MKPKAVVLKQHRSCFSIISILARGKMTHLGELVYYHKDSYVPLLSFGQMSDSVHRDHQASVGIGKGISFLAGCLCKFLLR